MRCKPSDPMRAVTLALVLLGFSAHATARRFDLVNDAATNTEGEIELEGWMDLGRLAAHRTNVMFWLGARIGLLDSLELASFLVFEKRESAIGAAPLDLDEGNGLMEWVTELRWRPVEVGKWPIDLFFQAQLIDWFEASHPVQFRLTLGASKQVARVLIAANLSFWASTQVAGPFKQAPVLPSSMPLVFGDPVSWFWLEPSVAVSVNLVEADGPVPTINLGVEAWAFIPLGTKVHSHLLMDGGLVVGPTLSASRGRLWLTAHLGIPVVELTPFPAKKPSGPSLPLVGRVMLGINL